MQRLVGFDEHGEVFDAGDVIHRRIAAAFKPEVANLHRRYREDRLATRRR